MGFEWATLGVQFLVGVGTIALAWVSFSTSKKAANASKVANDIAKEMRDLDRWRDKEERKEAHRAQARQIWVSMVAVELDAGEKQLGVLRIRNSSDRPVHSMRIESRGWSRKRDDWFSREPCKVAVVYPGDTIVRSRDVTKNWCIPETYFPHFRGDYSPMVGPGSDPYFILSAEFVDADGNNWRLENGHVLKDINLDENEDVSPK